MKQQQKTIYANVYRNKINDGDSQTSLLVIFSEGGGTSVHRVGKAFSCDHLAKMKQLLNTSLTSIDLPWVLFLKPQDLNKTKEPEDAGHEIECWGGGGGLGTLGIFGWGFAAGTL